MNRDWIEQNLNYLAVELGERRYRIVSCIGCGARLKIPKTEKLLEVKCPKCKKEFKVGTRYK